MRKTFLSAALGVAFAFSPGIYSDFQAAPPIITEGNLTGNLNQSEYLREYLGSNQALPDIAQISRLRGLACNRGYEYQTWQELLGGAAKVEFNYSPQEGFALQAQARYFHDEKITWIIKDCNSDGIIDYLELRSPARAGRESREEIFRSPQDLQRNPQGILFLGKVPLVTLQQAFLGTLEQIISETEGREGCIN